MLRTILVLCANPEGSERLRLDQEVREIDEGLQRRSRLREEFDIQQRWAVRPHDVHRALLDCRPQIVHFSGHGAGSNGIVLEDAIGRPTPVSADALSGLFELFPEIQCVLLSACYSEIQAEAIAQHVSYVVGMSDAIHDEAAISFAVAFYDAVGAGESYEFAFKIGRSAIQMAGVPEQLVPVLIKGPEKPDPNVHQETVDDFLERQAAEAMLKIAATAHSYAREVVMELMARLSESQPVLQAEDSFPSIVGEWQGMVDGRGQMIQIQQSGSVVYLKGSARGDSERSGYRFRGEGRIVCNTLVFSWHIKGALSGLNVMSLSRDGSVLDGKYFTVMGRSGSEIYHRARPVQERRD